LLAAAGGSRADGGDGGANERTPFDLPEVETYKKLRPLDFANIIDRWENAVLEISQAIIAGDMEQCRGLVSKHEVEKTGKLLMLAMDARKIPSVAVYRVCELFERAASGFPVEVKNGWLDDMLETTEQLTRVLALEVAQADGKPQGEQSGATVPDQQEEGEPMPKRKKDDRKSSDKETHLPTARRRPDPQYAKLERDSRLLERGFQRQAQAETAKFYHDQVESLRAAGHLSAEEIAEADAGATNNTAPAAPEPTGGPSAAAVVATADEPSPAATPPVTGKVVLEADLAAHEELNVFLKRGDRWEVRYLGKDSKWLDDVLGAAYIAYLVARPGKSLTAIELEVAVKGRPSGRQMKEEKDDYAASLAEERKITEESHGDDVNELAGPDAVQTVCDERVSLVARLKEAEADGDAHLVEELKRQIGVADEWLKSTRGYKGKSRKWADDSEKARKRVSKCIEDVRIWLDKEYPELARHLRSHLNLGRELMYLPPEGSVDWQV
jgi:hypothetical protein